MSEALRGETAGFSGRAILVGVTGSIAAFRAADLVSSLTRHGAVVTVVMTRSARRFVTPLTFETLSQNPVVTSLWQARSSDPEHVSLAREASCFVIAPATANCLAKLACGIADDAVTTTALVVRCPLVLAPAMNTLMWTHPAVQANLRELQKRGCRIVDPEEGRLACGAQGPGRLAAPERICEEIRRALKPPGKRSPQRRRGHREKGKMKPTLKQEVRT